LIMANSNPLSIKIAGVLPGEDAPGAMAMSKRYSLDFLRTGNANPDISLGIEKLRVLREQD